MVFFNHATRQMTAKIVYYGPGLCGKTTNLNTIYGKTSQKARGEMVSLNTETDRTLFFDLLPMDVGVIGGFKAKLQLYTVPGQVFYNSTRKLVLKGVDGIVFVADSQVPMLDANRESLQNLENNLKELGLQIRDIPMVFQWNKRDLKNIVSIEELQRELNRAGHPSFPSNAQEGAGVFETLRGITKLALTHIKAHH
ncbi:MAG TPA: GTPase domain-containing protein, partial [Holophaga sp.]|nr:GTPase domain-containing protein [Holophaga sp.]